MKIPNSNRRKALIVVDVQPPSINERTEYVVGNIEKLLRSHMKYDLYFEALFHAEKGSLWDLQHGWTFPKSDRFYSAGKIGEILKSLGATTIEKSTKSAFKGNINLHQKLTENKITEVHVVGIDTCDCVLATAYESFDLGFFTYVIEECCQVSTRQDCHESAIKIFQYINMTNNTVKETIPFLDI